MFLTQENMFSFLFQNSRATLQSFHISPIATSAHPIIQVPKHPESWLRLLKCKNQMLFCFISQWITYFWLLKCWMDTARCLNMSPWDLKNLYWEFFFKHFWQFTEHPIGKLFGKKTINKSIKNKLLIESVLATVLKSTDWDINPWTAS